MGRDSKIEWTDHTFNPWWGCNPVGPGCDNCYARALAQRFGKATWGPDTPRPIASEKVWADPLRWNAAAEEAGKPARVFCGSMCDWAEDRRSLAGPRDRLLVLVKLTPALEWLLLTKRPAIALGIFSQFTCDVLPNVRIGVSVENQETADERLPYLQAIKNLGFPTFVSAEPLIGPIDLSQYLDYIDWLIVGGENGPGARVMEPEWAIVLAGQAAGHTPFFFKGFGSNSPRQFTCGALPKQFPASLDNLPATG